MTQITMHLQVIAALCFVQIIVTLNATLLTASMKRIIKPLSLLSWNINGLRSFIKHDPKGVMLQSLLQRREVDVLCLQETKIQASHVPELDAYMKNTFGAHRIFWSCSRARKGYSGTAVLLFNNSEEHTKEDNHRTTFTINEVEGDVEGRTITLETDKFSLVNAYVPNSGAELAKLPYRVSTWDVKLAEHINELKARRPHVPVILTGDLNVAYGALDYHNPLESRTKLQAGTTPEEQASFRALLLQQCGLVDTFRAQYPEQRRYSYFSARLGDRGRRDKLGMRLDYVLAAMPQGTASATAQCGIRGVDVEAELAGGSAASGRGAVSILSGSITSTVASASMFAHHKADVLVQGATQPQPLSALNYDAYIEDELSHPYSDHCPVGAYIRV